jgi:hypothetical protein
MAEVDDRVEGQPVGYGGYDGVKGGVDHGPDSWAVILAIGMVALAIALGFLIGSMV